MDLPGEIRNLIYTFTLNTHAADKRKSKIRPVPSGMLLSNHLINREASSQTWKMCEVIVIGHIERLPWIAAQLGPANASFVSGMHIHGLLDGVHARRWTHTPWAVAYVDGLAPFARLRHDEYAFAHVLRTADDFARVALCLYFCLRGWIEALGEREGDRFAALDERHIAVRGGFDTHTRTYKAVHTERILEILRRHVEDPPLAARLRSAGKRKMPGREILDHKIPSINGEP